jgi:hypothetical protein
MSREMAERDLATLRDEVSRLEAVILAKREEMTKIAHYIEMAEKYERGTQNRPEEGYADSAHMKRERGAPRGGLSGRASRTSIDIIRRNGRPIKTRDLLEMLRKLDIEIRGKDPVVVLSGYLSRTDELVSDRKVGWGLKEWSHPNREEAKEHAGNGAMRDDDEAAEAPPNPPPPWSADHRP